MDASNKRDDSNRETSEDKNPFSFFSKTQSRLPRPSVSPYDAIDQPAPMSSSEPAQSAKRQKVKETESLPKTPDTASEIGHPLEKAALDHNDAMHNSASISSDLSPASAVTDIHSNRNRDSPVGKKDHDELPRAPPSTPASQSNMLAFDPEATPLPIKAEVLNSSRLMQHQRLFSEGAETPAPNRTNESSKLKTALADNFSEWAVGDRYQMMRLLGRGSYGEVAQALDLSAGKADAFVAIKRIRSAFDQEVDAIRLYRELHILRHMRHQCIIPLLDIIQPPTDNIDDFQELYLVFEYVDTDLWKLIMSPQYLTTEHIQAFLYQMLVALKYIHSFSVIHRDLKPANVLVNEDCSIRICDFGLARMVSSELMSNNVKVKRSDEPGTTRAPPLFSKLPLTRQLSKHVVTRWYRAPELILVQPYTSAVDIWSLGCILAELLSMQDGNVPAYENRKPLFPGGTCYPLSGDGVALKKDERIDQLSTIFGVIGTPSEEDLRATGTASEYVASLGKVEGKPFEKIFPAASPKAIDLLKRMLQFNPDRRITAHDALEHEFFQGIRQPHLEIEAASEIRGPAFIESDNVDLDQLKQAIFDEVRWYSEKNTEQRSKE